MLKYSDVETYVRAGLEAKGYGSANPDVNEQARTMPLIDPGPFTIERLRTKSPHSMLFLTVGNGVGTTTEGLYDRVFVTVRAIGQQNNYAYAETLAHDVDGLLLDVVNGVTMGTSRTLYVARTGGYPSLVDFDAGDRYHFQATYIAEVKR